MLEIKILVEAPAIVNAINHLADTVSAAQQQVEPQQVEPQQAVPQQAVPQQVGPQQVAPTQTQAQQYTLEAISIAGARLVDNPSKLADVMALLQKYGIQAINQLPADRYNEFAADLIALGAQF